MDALSHALLGAICARAAARRNDALPLRDRVVLGAAAGVFPDIDFVLFPVDPLRFLADWHQGPTHSLVLLPLWAALLAGVYLGWTRHRARFAAAAAVTALGLASHIAADLITAYGTALLYPLSAQRFAVPTTWVADPLFTLPLLTGLAWSLHRGTRGGAVAALGAVLLLVAAQAALREAAADAGRASARAHGLPAEALTVLPQPLSPFHWKLIVRDGDRHHVAHLNLAGHAPWVPDLPGLHTLHRLAAAYVPAARLAWQARSRYGDRAGDVRLAEPPWNDERFAPFRRFATHPALSRIDADPSCVWFTDLRYDLPTWLDTFRYGFCREGDTWRLYRLRYFSVAGRQRLE